MAMFGNLLHAVSPLSRKWGRTVVLAVCLLCTGRCTIAATSGSRKRLFQVLNDMPEQFVVP